MTEVWLFMIGFSAITTVYEITKSAKSTQSNKMIRNVERVKKNSKK